MIYKFNANGNCDCLCEDVTGNVLFSINAEVKDRADFDLDGVIGHLRGRGITVDETHSGNTDDYSLIFVAQKSDPSWWADITGGWSGRVVLLGECTTSGCDPYYPDYTLWASGEAPSMNLTDDTLFDTGVTQTSNILSADLTAGVSTLTYAGASEATGGVGLVKESSNSVVWMARNKVNGVDWVLCGDKDMFTNFTSHLFVDDPGNVQFVDNLYDVAV